MPAQLYWSVSGATKPKTVNSLFAPYYLGRAGSGASSVLPAALPVGEAHKGMQCGCELSRFYPFVWAFGNYS